MVALVSHYIMPQSHCTVGPSRRLRRTPDAAPGWTCVTRDRTWPTAGWSGITVGILVAPGRSKKSFKMFKTFVARPGSLPVFLLRDSTGKAPGRYRDHREGTVTTRKSVFYYGTKPVDPGGPLCWLRPGPRGSVLGLRQPWREFRILCLEDSVISFISPSHGPV